MSKKMKIVYLNGCTYSLEVDGTEFVSLSKEKQTEVCKRIIDSGKCSVSSMQSFVEQFVEDNGTAKDLGYCEQCGSYNDEYKVKL